MAQLLTRRSVVLAALLLPLATQAYSACGPEQGVRVAFSNALAPFAFVSGEHGIEIDIIRESLRRQGCKLVPVFMPFVRFGFSFDEGKVDAVATINEKSGIRAAYSDVYIEYHNVAVTLQSRGLAIKRIDDLKGLKVITFQGASRYLGDEFRRFAEKNPNYREVANQLSHNRLLYKGGVDVAIAERSIFAYLDKELTQSKFPERALPVTLHPLFPVNRYRIAFRDPATRDAFNRGFASMSKDDLKAIHDRYR